jgi:hypothetical protein
LRELLVLSALFCAVALADSEPLPIADLKAYRTDLEQYYPPTVCALKELLGPEYEAMLKRAYEKGLSGYQADWEKKDPGADSVLSVERHYQDEGNFALWFHRSGAIVAGIRTEKALLLFTNEGRRSTDLPAPFEGWIEEGKKAGLPVKWKRPEGTEALQFPSACRPEKLTSELERFRAAKAGKSCDTRNLDNLEFSQLPYLVQSQKAALLAGPSDDPNGKHSYLVGGDLVQVMQTDSKVTTINNRVCAFYRGAKGKISLGWVDQAALRAFPDTRSPEMDDWMKAEGSAKWPGASSFRMNYPGKYKSDNSKVADTVRIQPGTSDLKVKLRGDSRVFDTSSFSAKLANPRVARYEETYEGKPSQTASLYLFNNGVYVHLENHLMRTNYWAIYYP